MPRWFASSFSIFPSIIRLPSSVILHFSTMNHPVNSPSPQSPRNPVHVKAGTAQPISNHLNHLNNLNCGGFPTRCELVHILPRPGAARWTYRVVHGRLKARVMTWFPMETAPSLCPRFLWLHTTRGGEVGRWVMATRVTREQVTNMAGLDLKSNSITKLPSMESRVISRDYNMKPPSLLLCASHRCRNHS